MSTINAATMGRLSDLPTAAARRTSSEQKEKMQSVIANAEPPPRGQVKADNDPENLYARITKNGKLIAEVYKSGAVVRPNSVDLPSLTNEASDPADLKNIRIKEILEFTGGKVEYMDAFRTAAKAQQAKMLFETQLFASK